MAQNNREPTFTDLSIQIGESAVTFIGSFTLPDVQPLINKWFDALTTGATAAEEAALAARLKEETDKLKAAEQADAASHS